MYIYIIFTYVYILQHSATLYNSLQLSATLCVDARVLRFAASPGQRLASILIFFVPRVSIPIGVICSGNSSSQRFLMQLRIFCGMIGQAVSDHVCHGPPRYGHVGILEYPSLALACTARLRQFLSIDGGEGLVLLEHALGRGCNVLRPILLPHYR